MPRFSPLSSPAYSPWMAKSASSTAFAGSMMVIGLGLGASTVLGLAGVSAPSTGAAANKDANKTAAAYARVMDHYPRKKVFFRFGLRSKSDLNRHVLVRGIVRDGDLAFVVDRRQRIGTGSVDRFFRF